MGMTEEELEDSWGEAEAKDGRHAPRKETWKYGSYGESGRRFERRVFLQHGIVVDYKGPIE
jgi:hypothetical protein